MTNTCTQPTAAPSTTPDLRLVPAPAPADIQAEQTRQDWERALASVAAVREAFYDLAPPDVQAALDVLAALKAPEGTP